jgi:hypothetical protein
MLVARVVGGSVVGQLCVCAFCRKFAASSLSSVPCTLRGHRIEVPLLSSPSSSSLTYTRIYAPSFLKWWVRMCVLRLRVCVGGRGGGGDSRNK